MEPEYESGIQGIMYDVDESTLPHDFYDGDEAPVFSETQLTISSAIVKRNNGKGGTKHGGGTLSIEPGATVVKGKKKEEEGEKICNDERFCANVMIASLSHDIFRKISPPLRQPTTTHVRKRQCTSGFPLLCPA